MLAMVIIVVCFYMVCEGINKVKKWMVNKLNLKR